MWITITESKFLEQCTGSEVNAIKTAALATSQGEPLSATIAKVVQEVRGYVAACGRNRLDSDLGTIPGELEADAIAIVRYRALNRLPIKSLLTSTRETEYRDAREKMKDVAACRFSIEQPAIVSEQKIPGGTSVRVVTKTRRRAGRENLSGL